MDILQKLTFLKDSIFGLPTQVKTHSFPSTLDGIEAEFLHATKKTDGSYLLEAAGKLNTTPIGFHTWERTGNWRSRPLSPKHDPLDLSAAFVNSDPDKAIVKTLPELLQILKRYETAKSAVTAPIPNDEWTKQPHFSRLEVD